MQPLQRRTLPRDTQHHHASALAVLLQLLLSLGLSGVMAYMSSIAVVRHSRVGRRVSGTRVVGLLVRTHCANRGLHRVLGLCFFLSRCTDNTVPGLTSTMIGMQMEGTTARASLLL